MRMRLQLLPRVKKNNNNKKRSVIKMAARKRKTTAVGSSSSSTSKSKQSKRQASKEMFLSWQRAYEKEYQSMGLLRAEMDDQDKSLVSMLWCVVCRQYENKICGIKNFSRVWIEGSWWSDCSSGRRVNQKPRKEYRRHRQSSSIALDDSESENELGLDTWEDRFQTYSSETSD